MARPKKEAPKPVKVVKAKKEVIPRPKIDAETQDNLKKLFEQSKPDNVQVVFTPVKDIEKYLIDSGISFVYEGQKLSLTKEQIKSLILNW